MNYINNINLSIFVKPEKILIVSEYFYPEEFKINEIATAWKEKGYDVDILTQNPTYPAGKIFTNYENRWYSKEQYSDMTIYRVKAVTGYKESLFKKLLKYLAFMVLGSIVAIRIGKKYDYVFGFDVGALTGMVPAVLLKKFYNKKVTIWIQDVWPDSVYAYGFKKSKPLEFMLNGFVRFVYKNSSNFAVSGKGFINKVLPKSNYNRSILSITENIGNWSPSQMGKSDYQSPRRKAMPLDRKIKALNQIKKQLILKVYQY